MTAIAPQTAGPLPSSEHNADANGKAPSDVASKSRLGVLNVTIRPVGLVEAAESIQSLQAALRSGLLSDAAVESIKALFDLVSIDIGDLATFRTDKLSIHLEPSKKYFGCVAALSARDAERHMVRVEYSHAWPILSVVSRIPTVAEGAAPANAAPEGCQPSIREDALETAGSIDAVARRRSSSAAIRAAFRLFRRVHGLKQGGLK